MTLEKKLTNLFADITFDHVANDVFKFLIKKPVYHEVANFCIERYDMSLENFKMYQYLIFEYVNTYFEYVMQKNNSKELICESWITQEMINLGKYFNLIHCCGSIDSERFFAMNR